MNNNKEHTREEMTGSVGEILMYLAACALNEALPDTDIYSGVDSGLLYSVAKRHSIESLIAFTLENNGYKGIAPDVADRFRTGKNKAIRKSILFDAERGEMISFMEREKIRYLPLKGVVLQTYYPKYGMRQMADNDILYDSGAECRKKFKTFMVEKGYDAKTGRSAVHDCYYKEPVYNFEMHMKLFEDSDNENDVADYYRDVWSRAVIDDDKRYGYHFSDEDFYVYVITHANKHHSGSGTGIRTLTDTYVMNRVFADADRDYIDTELEKLGLSEFEKKIRYLAETLLSDPDNTIKQLRALPEDYRSELTYILTSGTYGTVKYRVTNRMKDLAGEDGKVTAGMRLRYCIKRTFPGKNELYPFYPPAKYTVLIPFVWVIRILRGIFLRSGNIIREVRILRNLKKT